MATTTWDSSYEAIPADNSLASDLGTVIRNLKRDISERTLVDHVWEDTTDAGKHNQVTLMQLAVAPSHTTDEGYVYQKDVGGNGELFYKDEAGVEIQLTVAGEINAAAIAAYAKDLVVTGSDILIDNAQHYQAQNVALAAKGILGITAGDIVEVGHDDFPTRILIDDDSGLSVVYDGGGDQEVWHAGNDGAGSGLDADLVDTHEAEAIFSAAMSSGGGFFFEIATIAPTANTEGAIAHSITTVPKLVTAALRCNDVGGDAGYAENDEIALGSPGALFASTSGVVFGVNGTNIFYAVATAGIVLLNKSDNTYDLIDESKWRLILRAWK